MARKPPPNEARQQARDVSEGAREAKRTRPSFAAEVFLGTVEGPLIAPFPEPDAAALAEAEPVIEAIRKALRDHLDPQEVIERGEIPAAALAALREAGAYRLKIPKDYEGLGFSQAAYNRAVACVAQHCSSTAILLSGHQSIGVPTPLKLFGTDEQKARYLPRLARGALSAFALTEPEAGSDPARLETTATQDPETGEWILSGEKLWCTNGPIAELIIVMARTPDRVIKGKPRKQISAFIVEMDWAGCEVIHRCAFMGYAGIHSGLLRFNQVRVPKENLLWGEGQGLKLALITLNTGRLTLPATNTAVAKQCLGIVRRWGRDREQWGDRIGDLEAVGVSIAWIAAHTFAMESLSDYAASLADRGDSDIRIEAAMAKLFCSEMVFEIADRTMQIRAGRGFETAASLKARGEHPEPVEQLFRESRLNRIVEGTSEIMRLFLAREALDPHLSRAGAFADTHAPFLARAMGFMRCALYYPGWYIGRWLPTWGTPESIAPSLRPAWRAMRRRTRSLARRIFHAMVRYGPGLEHRQALLGRLVDDGTDIVAMAATLARASARGDEASCELADLFCRHARQRIRERKTHPRRLDKTGRSVAAGVLSDRYVNLEDL